MCGVPHHAAANYIARLVRNGYRVAICEQAEPAAKGIKLVRREVVRVVTPGTAIDPQLIESKESVYLAALSITGEVIGAAFLELSTGDFSATQISGGDCWSKVRELIDGYSPRELLFPASMTKLVQQNFGSQTPGGLLADQDSEARSSQPNSNGSSVVLTPLDDDQFHFRDSEDTLRRQFNVNELSGFGLDGKDEAIRSAAACLRYAHYTQKATADHISSIKFFASSDCLVLDSLTLRNLEVVQSRNETGKRVLLSVIDETVTGMGGRLLHSWASAPVDQTKRG